MKKTDHFEFASESASPQASKKSSSKVLKWDDPTVMYSVAGVAGLILLVILLPKKMKPKMLGGR